MANTTLAADPYNLIITGVGGQGNVLASRIVGNALSDKGFFITIGETFGASQRGGSVMSHMRISTRSVLSPQIPKGKAHMVVALEPTEALRVLHQYGNRSTKMIMNSRPVYSVGVICGELQYPGMEDVKRWGDQLTSASWLIDATDEAVKLGNAILGNVMLIGALAAVGDLPLDKDCFQGVISRTMPTDKIAINMTAFEKGMAMVQQQTA